MTPFARAEKTAQQHPSGDNFLHDLLYHFEHGIVYSTPTAFVMGRAVKWDSPEILNLEYEFLPDEVDTWFVWLAAGDMSEFFSACAFPMDYVAFERNGKIRRWPIARFQKLCSIL
tara:strand:+ start:4588 stop:4932 length:345 start_codon:yes stop_codon:yes gene_type:complete